MDDLSAPRPSRLASLFRFLLGEIHYAPPSWLAALLAPFGWCWRRAVQLRRERPRAYNTRLLIVLTAVVAAAGGWYWHSTRPRPSYVTIGATWPAATPLEKDAKFFPLVLRFSAAAAPLADTGKEVTRGIKLAPPLPGVWKWESDTELTFMPQNDWPVGEKFTVSFEPGFFAPQVRLEQYSYPFESAPFKAEIEKSEFYEDPTDAKLKKVVTTVRFSHPVDKSSLEKRVGLKLRVEPVKDFSAREVKTVDFQLLFDEFAGRAFIHSLPIAIPEKPGEMLTTVAAGVQSARGGPGTAKPLEAKAAIPGVESYFRITAATPGFVTNAKHEMERILTIEATAQMQQEEAAKAVSLFVLPKDKPAVGDQKAVKNYHWRAPEEITAEVMALAEPVKIEWVPTEREFSPLQSFKFAVPTGSRLYLKVAKGLRSFGDYPLAQNFTAVLRAKPFPAAVAILHDGAILSLSGEKKLSLLARNLKAVQYEVSRILPDTISHLVTQTSGRFQSPDFSSWNFDFDNLAQVFTSVEALPEAAPGRNSYTYFDFARFMSDGRPPRGLFSLKVSGWDPDRQQPIYDISDRRLILVSDLGLLVKDSADNSHDVFVQSLSTGLPAAGARVDILGKNGLPILTQTTGEDGHVSFPDLRDFKREKTPVVYVVQKDDDLSFLPIGRYDRSLNLSRFDTGGLYSYEEAEHLQAYLFSDRGIYRPGDTVHLGMILKTLDWKPLPAGLPLELAVLDPRGMEIRRPKVKFGADGFEEYTLPTQETSPTGTYQFNLSVIKPDRSKVLLGSASIRVEEFLPDRMSIKAELSAPASPGWLSPAGLQGKVSLHNLFGTPAADRKVKGTLKLSPVLPPFSKYRGYFFFDPYKGKQSYDEALGEVQTDAEGLAVFDLKLERFEQATHYLRFIAEGFEPEGGRSVTTDTVAVVSPAPYLIAFKPDGDLKYINKGSPRAVHLIAVNPALDTTEVKDLSAELIEIRFVSVLTRQSDGTYAYQSVEKEVSRGSRPLALPAPGANFPLESKEPGSFAVVIRDARGTQLQRIAYSVIGEGNLNRSLERNAELQIKLSKPDYAPGEEVELEIQAPYSGAGLITIERDRIYNFAWFNTAAAGSVQRITVPEALEGNGYVTVTFLRALDSREIFMSPLSFGSAPFSVSRARRTQPLTLGAPELVKPGQDMTITYRTGAPAKIVVYAVDEGILQVARYRTPDPLAHFFRKRALEVGTQQILDLLLPEFKIVQELSAAGGDEDSLLARNLNPFKRKGEKPVAFWSGIIDSDGTEGEVRYPIPDYFNGTVRIMAVAVTSQTVGVAEMKTIARGPFVIQPHVPYFAAPGDEFEASATVANNVTGSGPEAKIKLALEVSGNLEILGEAAQEASIPEGQDRTMVFRVRALPRPGAAKLTLRAAAGAESSSYSLEMSVRPASPYTTAVTSGAFRKGLLKDGRVDVPLTRKMYPELRTLQASAAAVPLGFASGLAAYLVNYPHGCTEQVTSAAFPAVVLERLAEVGIDPQKARTTIERALAVLQGRQNSDGAFGFWTADSQVSSFQTVYATHFLLEARERGFEVPPNLYQRAVDYLNTFASAAKTDLAELRAQAYAIYVLTRGGRVTTPLINTVRQALEQHAAQSWKEDLAALHLASSYKLLKLDREADQLFAYGSATRKVAPDYGHYYDALVYRAVYLYLAARHFPDRAAEIAEAAVFAIADEITNNRFNTTSAAFSILALDAYARAAGSPEQTKLTISEVLPDNQLRALPLSGALFPKTALSADIKGVRFEGDSRFPLFYQVLEAGFDREPPAAALSQNLEIFREYRDEQGAAVRETSLTAPLNVELVVRAPQFAAPDLAVVDLLPGGFEVDITPEGLGSRASLKKGDDAWQPDYIDIREDRVVFYGYAQASARRFVYRIKPVNRGSYAVPPLYAEGMYDRRVQARTLGGRMTVK